jgi:hypothetical protein
MNIHHPASIDECSFNIWTARSQGGLALDSVLFAKCADKRDAAFVFGLVHHTIQMGGMTKESFTEFLAGTATHLDENETQYLILDGAPAHRRPEQPRDNIHLRI